MTFRCPQRDHAPRVGLWKSLRRSRGRTGARLLVCEALRRAFENLGSNAVKYGSNDKPITFAVGQQSGRVFVRVHNHGSHIPIEEQETIFQAFRRTREAMASGKHGWGLGLALVRGVAEAHGGSVAVDSLSERGTTFVIDMPVDARPFQSPPSTD